MASKCKTCAEMISNADYVTCEGACLELFQIKCVALTKTALNAVQSNANVHWYCHDCNSSNRNVSSSVESLKHSVEQLTQSLSVDLGSFTNGFKVLSGTLIGNLAQLSKANDAARIHERHSNAGKRRREDSDTDPITHRPHKKIIFGSNARDGSMASSPVTESLSNTKTIS